MKKKKDKKAKAPEQNNNYIKSYNNFNYGKPGSFGKINPQEKRINIRVKV